MTSCTQLHLLDAPQSVTPHEPLTVEGYVAARRRSTHIVDWAYGDHERTCIRCSLSSRPVLLFLYERTEERCGHCFANLQCLCSTCNGGKGASCA